MSRWPKRTLMEDMLARGVDDWLNPAEIYWIAARAGTNGAEATRALAIGLVAEAICSRLLVAGDVTDEGFVPWECRPETALARIVEDWIAWGDAELTPGAICWLNLTDSGQRLGEQVLVREAANDHSTREA